MGAAIDKSGGTIIRAYLRGTVTTARVKTKSNQMTMLEAAVAKQQDRKMTKRSQRRPHLARR